jgi:choline kinase
VVNLSVIIPAAGLGRRMRSYGPKALINIGRQQTVLSRQLTLIEDVFPRARIFVVGGFEAEKIRRILPRGVIFIENKLYEETNVAYSLKLGLEACKSNRVLIIYGDLVFNKDVLSCININNESSLLIDSKEQFSDEEVGVTVVDNFVTRLSYGLPNKWAQIAYLTGNELEQIKKELDVKHYRRLYGFEIINKLLDVGCKFVANECLTSKFVELDTSKDIQSARGIVCE